MNILIIDHDPNFTGSTISLIYLLKKLEKNNSLTVLTNKSGVEFQRLKDSSDIVLVKLPAVFNLNIHFNQDYKFFSPLGIYSLFLSIKRFVNGLLFAKRYIKQTKPDLVYVNEYVLMQFSLAAKSLGVEAITHVRSKFIDGNFGVRKLLISKYLLKSNKKIIAISEIEKSQFLIGKNRDTDKIFVVNEFLSSKDFDTSFDQTEIKKRIGLNPNKIVVLFLGGIFNIKGSLLFLKAATVLLSKRSDVVILFIGDQSYHNSSERKYYNECQKLIQDINLNNNFIEISEHIEIKDYFNICDIYVNANQVTHFARPIIEAWAKKKSVVCSNTLHNCNLVSNNKDSLLFEKNDYNDLAEKLELLLENIELRNWIAKEGFEKASQYFNDEVTINQIIKIISIA